MRSRHSDCESRTMGGAVAFVIGKPTVYCLLSQLLTHTPYITANPIQPSPPNRPSAKSFFVCPPHSHFHIYKWPALSRQLASPPVVSVDVYFILIELLTTVCIQAKRPVNNSLPQFQIVLIDLACEQVLDGN